MLEFQIQTLTFNIRTLTFQTLLETAYFLEGETILCCLELIIAGDN